MTSEIGSRHAWHDESYVRDWIDDDATDDERRRPLLRRAAALLPLGPERGHRVLDVGGGYGEFSRQVLEVHPRATVCVLDHAAPMLEHARERLGEFGDRVEYVQADLTAPDWHRQVTGPFDAAVSGLALHNLGDPGVIGAAYAGIHELLTPGSWLFDLDLALDVVLSPANSPLARLYTRADRRETEHRELAHGERGEPGTDVPGVGLEQRLGLLRSAGFDAVDCLRKDLSEIFLVARRGSRVG